MPKHGVDFDRTADRLSPFGEGANSYDHALIKSGTCAIDSDHYSEADVMRLGQCSIAIFNGTVQGHFMWTVHNELEPRWNYVTSYDKGWIKNKTSAADVFLQ